MKINQQYFLADVILGVYVHALYKFTCAGCNAYYVGKTIRHILYMSSQAPCVRQGFAYLLLCYLVCSS